MRGHSGDVTGGENIWLAWSARSSRTPRRARVILVLSPVVAPRDVRDFEHSIYVVARQRHVPRPTVICPHWPGVRSFSPPSSYRSSLQTPRSLRSPPVNTPPGVT